MIKIFQTKVADRSNDDDDGEVHTSSGGFSG